LKKISYESGDFFHADFSRRKFGLVLLFDRIKAGFAVAFAGWKTLLPESESN